MSISIFENDVEQEEQYKIIKEFLQLKGDRKPYTTLRLIGNINEERYKIFKCLIVKRTLHLPKGSVEYRREPTIPEIGICWDFLTRLAINKKGDVSVCVRYDPEGELILGNLRDNTLDSLWNSDKRLRMKAMHVLGKRHEIPYCGDKCHYWGVPTAS
jgi:radical SAM protein with 4Fe4S-binding SPASM domain